VAAEVNVEIIAHRGASFDAPENTLAAISLAWKQNADAVEVDVHLSKDGQIVVIHDASTGKTTGLKKKVCDQTLAELKALDAGSWKNPQWSGERIPTLDQVMAAIPTGKRLFIEIKCGPGFVPAFGKVLERSGKKPEQIIPIGFSLPILREVKRTLPELQVCWVAEFKRSWKTGRWTPQPETLIQNTSDAGLDGLDLGANGPITASLVRQVKAAGLKLYVWTVDAPAKARRLAAAGIDGITTNRPGWLREQLQQ
jgi:glycerophosphoryl diester phosphodiesterase